MNVVLYARVSSDRQADKGASIPSQIEELHRWCDREGHTVLREFTDEGISGTTDKRPGFQSMIAFCKLRRDEVDAVVVWKLNRFSRDRVDSAVYKRHLRTHGVNVISITHIPRRQQRGEGKEKGLAEAVEAKPPQVLLRSRSRHVTNTCRAFTNSDSMTLSAIVKSKCPARDSNPDLLLRKGGALSIELAGPLFRQSYAVPSEEHNRQ